MEVSETLNVACTLCKEVLCIEDLLEFKNSKAYSFMVCLDCYIIAANFAIELLSEDKEAYEKWKSFVCGEEYENKIYLDPKKEKLSLEERSADQVLHAIKQTILLKEKESSEKEEDTCNCTCDSITGL
jgi:hypothetical protein